MQQSTNISTSMFFVSLTILGFTLSGCGGSEMTPTAEAASIAESQASEPSQPAPIPLPAPSPQLSVTKPSPSQAETMLAANPEIRGAENNIVRDSSPPPSAVIDLSNPKATFQKVPPPAASEKNSVAWRLEKIAELIVPPPVRVEIQEEDGTVRVVDRSSKDIQAERIANLQEIIQHANAVIVETHNKPQAEKDFNNAVHYLGIAHVELAVRGNAQNARKLSETAEAIFRDRPQSWAAAEMGYRVVDLAKRMSDLYGEDNPEWTKALATQAVLFATRFPQEKNRAALSLMDAGWACDLDGLSSDARRCYSLIARNFRDTPYAEQIQGILRRLNLEGRVLEAADLGGPTIDGGFLSIDQFRGKYVLIVFWMSDSPTLLEDLPTLKKLEQKYQDRLEILGVNLDIEETAVDHFVEKHQIGWRQIFDPDPASRGSKNPVAFYYGVTTVPTYWLIDNKGKVLQAPADLRTITLP